MIKNESFCPCFSGKPFAECCESFLSGKAVPPSAEALMRSRYAAFATGNIDYLETTLLPEKRHAFNQEEAKNWALSSTWIGLNILFSENDEAKGVVEFIARYRQNGREMHHHETSRFISREGRWYYVDGQIASHRQPDVGRNDPCPCGSGKKYKKCCGI